MLPTRGILAIRSRIQGHAETMLAAVGRLSRAVERPLVILFFACAAAAAVVIGITGNLGIYYDYYLLPKYPLIHHLNQGGLSVEEYLLRHEHFEPQVQLFTNIGGLRFHPLYKVDYQLLLKLFGGPEVLWVYRGITFLLLVFALYQVSRVLAGSRLLAVATIVLLVLPHSGFWHVWTTLTATSEGQAAVATSLCLYFYVQHWRRPTTVWLISISLFAAVALCFKEPTFIALPAFAGTHLVLSWLVKARREAFADIAILVSVAAVGTWFFFDEVLRFLTHNDPSYSETVLRSATTLRGFDLLFANLLNYLASDPALLFLLGPLLLFQIWRVVRGGAHDRRERIILAMLVASAAWLGCLLVLGLSMFPYYTVPAYCFAVPGIAGVFGSIAREVEKRTWQALLAAGITIILCTLSVVELRPTVGPSAWNVFVGNRMEVRKWGLFLDGASAIIERNAPNKTYFYFYKSPRGGTVELRESFIVFLVSRGFLPKDFDLVHSVPDHPSNPDADGDWATPATPWSWNRKDRLRPMESGDYLVVNSWWPLADRNAADAVLSEHDLVYATNGNLDCEFYTYRSPVYRARTSAKNLWRGLRGKDLLPNEMDPRFEACPIFSNRKNFYIFRKR